ncbi:secreted PhoX family phosphatase [Kibdelosporangium banguiense]|uniref:Secreted PhoX family phosphatase n=1 Tax=Kibdelosporangium banguiense TaxID=1365924 RepID=A0ABS4TC48_9PSEU|nr:PhoX family phosphatase [Kibdelosporangium banguiense]MBP2321906.1 secreted PhoX family phosphatase [Kibdelosporangium banguiense]
MTPPRIRLPLLHDGGRAQVTCEYKCGNACAHEPPNPSGNDYMGDIVTDVISRRRALQAGAAVAFTATGIGSLSGSAAADEQRGGGHTPGLNFDRVQPNTLDAVVVPKGYEQAIVIRWGDPVLPGAPKFDFDKQTAAAQAKQFGFNNDFAALMPLPGDNQLLVTNHEYTSENFMFKGYSSANPTREQAEIGWAAHGLSVVEVEPVRRSGALRPVIGRYNRRITMTTPFRITGPAAGSDLLKTSADPTGTVALGTLNNCAGGVTPWGTILSGEENFNQYWANAGQTPEPVKSRAVRYGVTTGATARKWERFDKRFDMLQEPNEVNRFGYVIELDPNDPDSTPVKHTALGRFKHECANIRVARDGRVVAYSGDDERFEYLYKFVSKNKMRPGNSKAARRYNMTLLDEGTLYVARFTGDSPASEIDGTGKLPSDKRFDGSGEWIPLASGNRSFVPGMTAEEVYVFTRLAGDKVGATKMDRPEDVQASPKTGKVYVALSNNVERGVTPGKESATEINPRNNNKHGHVLELTEHDPLSLRFDWWLFMVCGDPNSPDTYFAGFPKDQVSPITSPDNVAFDQYGNLWIATDSANALGINDGLYGVPVDGPQRGNLKLFLTVPRGGETCGPIVQERVVTVCVQHPGEVDGANADNPVSHWPDGGASQPRPAVVAVWKPGRHGPDRIGS